MALLPVGTPLWKLPVRTIATTVKGQPSEKKDQTVVVLPTAVTANHTVFVGVTTRHNEDSTKKLWVQHSGLLLVRVNGGTLQSTVGEEKIYVEVGDKLVRSLGHDYLVKEADGDDGAPVVGEARERVGIPGVRLIQVMAPAGGAGTGESTPVVWA